jgi:ketosteroid isomerase-like protein
MEFAAEDIVVQHPVPRETWPWAGEFQGKQKLSEFIAQGDKVVLNVFERGRSKVGGPFFDNDYVYIYTVRDGKITALRIFEDTTPIHAALGPV